MSDKHEWKVSYTDGKVAIRSDDFTHDAVLYLSGDFATHEVAINYALKLAARLSELRHLSGQEQEVMSRALKASVKIVDPGELIDQYQSDGYVRVPRTGYMCMTAAQHELGHTDVRVYPTVEHLKAEESCADECGIAKVRIEIVGMTQAVAGSQQEEGTSMTDTELQKTEQLIAYAMKHGDPGIGQVLIELGVAELISTIRELQRHSLRGWEYAREVEGRVAELQRQVQEREAEIYRLCDELKTGEQTP